MEFPDKYDRERKPILPKKEANFAKKKPILHKKDRDLHHTTYLSLKLLPHRC